MKKGLSHAHPFLKAHLNSVHCCNLYQLIFGPFTRPVAHSLIPTCCPHRFTLDFCDTLMAHHDIPINIANLLPPSTPTSNLPIRTFARTTKQAISFLLELSSTSNMSSTPTFNDKEKPSTLLQAHGSPTSLPLTSSSLQPFLATTQDNHGGTSHHKWAKKTCLANHQLQRSRHSSPIRFHKNSCLSQIAIVSHIFIYGHKTSTMVTQLSKHLLAPQMQWQPQNSHLDFFHVHPL